MQNVSAIERALSNHLVVPGDWFPASQVRPFFYDDPAIVWLEYHGARHSFRPDLTPYLDFIAEKARQFENKWMREMAPGAVCVCREAGEVLQSDKVRQTFDLMQQGAPVIAQPALWWAPERIYGVPDFIALASWMGEKFPGCFAGMPSGQPDHYLVLDLKFTSKLDESQKAKDLASYAAQVRLYSYMLGQLQGAMPARAYLVTRDRVADPLPVEIASSLDQPLDGDLAALRDRFVEIKVNGARYLPWLDAVVASNPANQDDRWRTARETIAREKVPGGDTTLLYQVGYNASRELAALGFPSLASLLQVDPAGIPLESVKGIGAKKAGQIRAVLAANRANSPVLPPAALIPQEVPFEFYIDYEFFPNVDVDFDRQWPALEGREMIFMIGVGWEENDTWCFERFIAEMEDSSQERKIFADLIDFLESHTSGAFTDPSQTAIYHWSSAEVWQTQRVADRHALAGDHPLRRLPWVNLQKVFLDGPAALPGAFDFGLKTVAGALGALEPAFASLWPEDLGEGQQAMVLGWKAYRSADPPGSGEMLKIAEYLEADCRAVWNVLRWLRKSSGKHG